MADTEERTVEELVSTLCGASRRARQEAAHEVALVAADDPAAVVPHTEALIDALARPEAQTRWEVLGALSSIVGVDADAVEDAFEGAEESLFDDDSATVRLSAFVFLSRLGATSAERSDRVWPLLDEAVQCYHGDAEYRDMLVALVGLAQGKLSAAASASLADRVRFDAENGSGFTKAYSAQIIQALS